jgi:hypothetical protein
MATAEPSTDPTAVETPSAGGDLTPGSKASADQFGWLPGWWPSPCRNWYGLGFAVIVVLIIMYLLFSDLSKDSLTSDGSDVDPDVESLAAAVNE